jgi:hypothetical protein
MDYYSVLGPIDPQVNNKDGKLVPALGYLDKINELIIKSHGRLINIEILENDLKLKIEDFGKDQRLSLLIRNYHRLIVDYVNKNR